jgi:ABC-type thiamine transport system substrate-binding protein
VSHRQSKTLINKTALEVDDMDSTFIELYEIVKNRPQCQEILQDYNYDDIFKIQITEQTQAYASIEVTSNMKIGTCENLNCKFIQFHISSKESIPKTSPCDPHKPNAFAVMLAAYNELQPPPPPPPPPPPQSQLVKTQWSTTTSF